MDRDVALSWLNEFDALTDDGIKAVGRIISRLLNERQGQTRAKCFPFNPADVFDKTKKRFTSKELHGTYDYEDEEMLEYTIEYNKEEEPVKKINGWVEFKVNDPINFVTLSPNVNKKEEDMYNAEQNARRHLTDRAHDVYGHKMDDIRVVTNVNGTQPKTLGELKEMLVAGNYTISGNDDQKLGKYTHAQDYIRLGPAFDEKKYEELVEQLRKDKQSLDDTIYVAAPADGLKALQEFESKVYN